MSTDVETIGPQRPLMTVAEVAHHLAVGETTVREMCRGPLAHATIRVGTGRTGLRVIRRRLEEWIENEAGRVGTPGVSSGYTVAKVRAIR